MRWFRPRWVIRQIVKVFFLSILSLLILVTSLTFFQFLWPLSSLDNINKKNLPETSVVESHFHVERQQRSSPIQLVSIDKAPVRRIGINDSHTTSTAIPNSGSPTLIKRKICNLYNCFDIHRCGRLEQDLLTVYVYPIEKFELEGRYLQTSLSREFYEILDAIIKSPYYVTDPSKACIFVPTIDILNLYAQAHSVMVSSLSETSWSTDIIAVLRSWGNTGQNHLLFTMFPGSSFIKPFVGEAILAASAFSTDGYGLGFNIPLISYNPLLRGHVFRYVNNTLDKKIVAVSAQGFLSQSFGGESVLVLDFCSHDPSNYTVRCKAKQIFYYPEILTETDYCIVYKELSHPILWDIMNVGCIPVIVAGLNRLPLDEVIDWRRNAILLHENQLEDLRSILIGVSDNRKKRLKSQIRFTFNKYFKTMGHLTRTILEVIKDRIFPHSARTLYEWNNNPEFAEKKSPILNPVTVTRTPGFTAVILAYERIDSLFQVIERVGLVPSLAKILVIWNNQVKKPPAVHLWPKTSKPLKIIETKANKMSNRFYPYDEIETEAVFSVDDDIIMLTTDEIDFAFEAWREYSDRIVGFPSRTHRWDNSTQRWKYESEWTNDISMVLTGAAFYHKYWHHAYFHELPNEIREWVDLKMNCEDIAMNFLVAHRTGNPPMKVTPRKKFKCPTCSSNEMLSADTGHMVERTDCINKFAQIYGYMPLLAVEFRGDPVLFKVNNLPNKLKMFSNIGSL